MKILTKEEKINFLENLELPILIENNQQLQFMKEGKYVDCYDPVYEIECKEDKIVITGFFNYKYSVSYDIFDYILINN